MLDVIGRFFGDLRPADWLMCSLETLFIAVILWLEVPERWHKHKVRKTLKIVERIMLDGHNLKDSVSDANVSNEAASKWIVSAQKWIVESHKSLADQSLQAGLAFMHRNVAADIKLWRGYQPSRREQAVPRTAYSLEQFAKYFGESGYLLLDIVSLPKWDRLAWEKLSQKRVIWL